jgi:hypothetical protein
VPERGDIRGVGRYSGPSAAMPRPWGEDASFDDERRGEDWEWQHGRYGEHGRARNDWRGH